MSVTIREVASRAGVSIATVSRVFNNSDPVDEGTRERVKKAATELRYIPNVLGRSLSMRRTDSIGLLLPDLFGEFFSRSYADAIRRRRGITTSSWSPVPITTGNRSRQRSA